jgi:hypothetical protein
VTALAASTTLTPEQRSERSAAAARARWDSDPAGIDAHIDALVRRAAAMTPEQTAKIGRLFAYIDPDADR